jgi:4-amino-4-deoxy-L-arabinose transferase-like glycosyltransferase
VSRLSILLGVLAASVALYFVNLNVSSIWDANEAFYVETPREMIESGDYISPTFNYEPRLNKPVLSYWIVAAFYHVFGVSVAVQRIPIALGALVMIGAAFVLGRLAWPVALASRTGALLAGVWAAVGLAIAPRLVMFARRIFIDIYISMFMALILLFFALSERYPARRRTFLILMYVSVGLGVLTKGPAFALLPGLVFAVYLTIHGELRRTREMLMPTGVLVVSAIVVPWYAALYYRYGWTYIVSFVLGENFARYTDGVGVNATRGPLFYVPVVFSDSFPWSVFLVLAAVFWFRDRKAALSERDPGFRIQSLLWIWILTIVIFFSFSEAKQDLYIFPIVPAVAALGGVAVARAITGSFGRQLLPNLTIALAVAVALLGAGVLYLFQGSGAIYALKGMMVIGLLAMAGGTATAVAARRWSAEDALLVLAGTMAALNWFFVLRVLPSFEAYKPVPGFALVLGTRAQPDDVIATYNVALPSLVYYLRRHVEMSYQLDPIVRLLDDDRTAYVITPREHEAAIAEATEREICIVSAQPTFDVKLRNVIARDPLPNLVLLTNRCR